MNSIIGVIVKKEQRPENDKIIDLAILSNNGRRVYLECHKKKNNQTLVDEVSSLSLLTKVEIHYTDYAYIQHGKGNRSVIDSCIRLAQSHALQG